MQVQRVSQLLDSRADAADWFKELGVSDVRASHASLVRLADSGIPLDLLGGICEQFAASAPELADPDMGLFNLERFLLSARSPLSTAALFERDPAALPQLLTLLTASQNLSDLLCTDPESYDFLRMTEGLPVARDVLVDELVTDVRALQSDSEVLAALRRFKRRETLRIAYGDIVCGLSVEQVTRQISYVADALIEAALDCAQRQVMRKYEKRNGRQPPQPRQVVLALGKLGGLELNYSSDIDLVFLHEPGPQDRLDGAAAEFANRVAQEMIRLLSEKTDLGAVYRIDMRLRPEGRQAPLSMGVRQALSYYDTRGRTWERQAFVKARTVAGDLPLGEQFLQQLEPWVYSRYLSLADIAGIKALKRRIERAAESAGVAQRDVKTGRGGIRDVEFVIQFLQLLNGGSLASVRTGNTLDAIGRLEHAGCLSHRERSLLEENYRFLRKVEHRLQVMFDLQTHEIPVERLELRKLAKRMGYVNDAERSARQHFLDDFKTRTAVNRKVLDHLLHDAFADDPDEQPEVDLINAPDPDPETIDSVLGRYPFRDSQLAYERLMSLASENVSFLSTRRCRLFLASISPRLLSAISQTPDPDATLVALCRVSDSLGGKAALWELFSTSHASLNMYVTLCAACPYLAGLLTSNPGMIDELLDSLLVEKLPNLRRLEETLTDLTRGAEDIAPIVHSFKNAQHLRVGIRDILGKDAIQATHRVLSDIAETCLKKLVADASARMAAKFGEPRVEAPPAASAVAPLPPWTPGPECDGQRSELIILALGKLGGREPNYHSDLDIVFLYEADGRTSGGASTSNSHFFGELAQRIIKAANHFGPYGRLYEVDPRLRPTGRSGQLAISLEAFVRYFQEGGGELWERQALCKSRVLFGSERAAQRAVAAVDQAVYGKPWQASDAEEIYRMRMKLQETASQRNIKRGPGGTMDAEFAVQMLQLKHGRQQPEVRLPGTLDALAALDEAGCLAADQAQALSDRYEFLRNVEARIRLMDSAGRHEFPEDPAELAKLAYLMGYADPDVLAREVESSFAEMRKRFEEVFAAENQ